ncbi:hypothetical protein [Saccharothrix sp.]|uniref:hypothetical protein n=1 Tax=Saccharothrix sp. TaxID=1873460 RepID=UPI002810BDC1|nr:hypothetical protein [Saccharothrix sp.]
MGLPFFAHAAVLAEFRGRWRRVFPLLVTGFLGPPVESVVTAVVGGGRGAAGWVVLGIGCLVPVVFFVLRGYVRWSGWWVVVVGAVVQVVGVAAVTDRAVLVVPPVVAAILGVVLVVRAHQVLFDAEGGAIAGTSLVMRSRTRSVPGMAGWKPVLAFATVDDRWLRWRVGTGSDLHGGEVALRDVSAVWVAHADEPPGGPVVAVRAEGRVIQMVVGDPEGFAWLLDRRLRALGSTPEP